jgi:hypothetical protein
MASKEEVVVKSERLFDVRVVERNIEKGRVTQAEYDAHLAKLADMKGRSTELESEFVEGVLLVAAARQAKLKAAAEAENPEDED